MATAIRFAYDGSRFEGYARNPGKRSVEAALIEALVEEGASEDSFRTGSRTDRGVGALENVCRIDLERPHLRGLVPAVQAHLQDGLWITGAATLPADWNPRHAAYRRYRYIWPAAEEDLGTMRDAAACFVGQHDMHAFARVEPPRDPVRHIQVCRVEREEGVWRFTVQSPGFLWNQVRRMVAAILEVGRGNIETGDIRQALQSSERSTRLGQPMPPEGLLLERVHYPNLSWDEEAGRIRSAHLRRPLLDAQNRLALLQHLQHT